jgi:hypothetical protein
MTQHTKPNLTKGHHSLMTRGTKPNFMKGHHSSITWCTKPNFTKGHLSLITRRTWRTKPNFAKGHQWPNVPIQTLRRVINMFLKQICLTCYWIVSCTLLLRNGIYCHTILKQLRMWRNSNWCWEHTSLVNTDPFSALCFQYYLSTNF